MLVEFCEAYKTIHGPAQKKCPDITDDYIMNETDSCQSMIQHSY